MEDNLPVDIAATYGGTGSRLVHQQNHDALHAVYNSQQGIGDYVYLAAYNSPLPAHNPQSDGPHSELDHWDEDYNFNDPNLGSSPGATFDVDMDAGTITLLEGGLFAVYSYISLDDVSATVGVSLVGASVIYSLPGVSASASDEAGGGIPWVGRMNAGDVLSVQGGGVFPYQTNYIEVLVQKVGN